VVNWAQEAHVSVPHSSPPSLQPLIRSCVFFSKVMISSPHAKPCVPLPVARGCNIDNVPSIGTLLACCQGLVAIHKEASSIRLIHFTLQEYLRAHPG